MDAARRTTSPRRSRLTQQRRGDPPVIRTHTAGSLRAEHVGRDRDARRLGGASPRPRRRRLPRPARRLRRGAGGRARPRGGAPAAQRVLRHGRSASCRARPEGNANPDLPTGEIEVVTSELEVLSDRRAAAVPDRRARRGRRGGAAAPPLPRPASSGAGRGDPAAQPGQPDRPRRPLRPRLRRDRDAHADPLHARGRPRLPGARAAAAGQLVRAAAEPAAVQAAAHGRRAWSATSRSRAATATRTSAPTGSRSSPSSTSR